MRPAKRSDISEFYGQLPKRSVRAWVWERDGEIVGVAGFYMLGVTAFVFSDIQGDAPKITIWREAKRMMDMIQRPAICLSDSNSGAFLERLGWVTEDGEVYKWRHSY